MPQPLDPELVDQIRASLYAGRGVRLFGDDSPTTMLEPSTQMTAEGDAFFTSKLEKVADLLERGFVVNIDSEGSILASTPDKRSRYISTQEAEIDTMDRIMVKTALEQGAKVSFEADGSLVVDGDAAAVAPSPAHAAAQFAEFERLADAGDINSQLAAGQTFSFDAAAVPDPAPPLEDPFDTAAELEAEADSLQLGLEVARGMALPEFSTNKEAAELERVAAERRLAMVKAESDTAEQQATASQADAVAAAEAAVRKRAEAQQLRDSGSAADAASADADADNFEVIAQVNARVAASAQQAVDDADARILEETEAVDRHTVASAEVTQRASELEQAFDGQESQASAARQAAAELAEAERLEAALPDLEARGVASLERVHAAIATHRAAAEALVTQGNLRATTDLVLDSDVVDPDLIELEPNEPIDVEQPVGQPTDGIDADLIELEPNDPVDVEQPAELPTDGVDPDLIELEPVADAGTLDSFQDPAPATDFSDDAAFADDLADIEQTETALDDLTDL